jgi:hypothetical protein
MNIRHGDVLIFSTVVKLPAEARMVPPGARGIVLAEGEVTGHAHRIADVAGAVLYEWNGGRYLDVVAVAGVTLRHEEHHAVTIPKGLHEIKIQREYSPEGWRYVAD